MNLGRKDFYKNKCDGKIKKRECKLIRAHYAQLFDFSRKKIVLDEFSNYVTFTGISSTGDIEAWVTDLQRCSINDFNKSKNRQK